MNFLSVEQVKKEIPSAFAQTHDGNRSNRYSFVSTEQMIKVMDSEGFGISRVRGPKSRNPLNKEYGIHEIYFRSKDLPAIVDPRTKMLDGSMANIFPELKIMNSHNGQSKTLIHAALFCLICSNGLTISKGTIGEFSAPHVNFDHVFAIEIISKLAKSLPLIQDKISTYNTITLDKVGAREYAMKGAKLRWGDGFDGNPETLLKAKRAADEGMDLWSVFNRVQENLIKGGTKVGKRTNRELTQLRLSNIVNEGLWDLTEEFSKKTFNES